MSRADAYAYVEGVLRGGTLVLVSCSEDEVAQAVSILDQEGVLDLDEQQTSWRSEGWQENATEGLADVLNRGSDLTGANPDVAGANRPDPMSHGRIRIQPSKMERPVQK